MECNRDEATRAKEIAENKFQAKDFMGAKKFAVKAESLYPGLDGIQQMLTTLNVYISSENRVNGETDWYKILDVNPRADEETIRKQYRKLALMLHPDKNKSIGADGAFKLISEAWSLLSDKAKRSVYDQKRNIEVFKQKVPPPGSNGVNYVYKSTAPKAGVQKGKAATKTSGSNGSASSNKKKNNSSPTFWTVCHRCRMQHEYLRMYVNRNLLCPNCNLPYYAFETPPPTSNVPKPSTQPNPFQQKLNVNHQGPSKTESTTGFSSPGSSNQTNSQWVPFSNPGGAPLSNQAATMVQQAYEKAKREREEAQAAMRREREEALKRKSDAPKNEGGSSSDSNAMKRRKVMEDVNGTGTQGTKTSSYEPDKGGKVNKPKSSRDLPKLEIPKVLAEKAKVEIRKKLNEWNSNTAANSAVKSKKIINERANGEVTVHGNGTLNDSKQENHKNSKPISIAVPDSDFHDFDKDRMETCFGENQVWAAYDGDDGMPRYYALIHEMISLNPFKMRISWLNSKTNTELGPLNWVGSGFTKTCGDFGIGKQEINGSLNSFSHKVRWTKGDQRIVSIFPKRGDVWALYRNWSPEWNELTEDEVIHKYDMVEVLEDYDDKVGVRVTPLVKVAGFRTVFHRHLDESEMRRIPREELFRFSHQVPSFLLSGQEGTNAPKGCRELDPAATPVELLQVIADINDNTMENEGKSAVENQVDAVADN